MIKRIFKGSAIIIFGLITATPVVAYQLYFNETDFLAAAPYVSIETFEEGDVSENAGLFLGPLDSTTDNGIFSTGDILPGLSISALNSNDYLKLFTGTYFGMTGDTAISNSNDVHPLNLDFGVPGVTAVGFNLIFESPSVSNAGVTFFDSSSDVILGELEIESLTYLGIIAEAGDALISRVLIDNPFGDLSGRFEAVDNVAFGSNSSSNVPEPTSLVLMGIGLAGLMLSRKKY